MQSRHRLAAAVIAGGLAMAGAPPVLGQEFAIPQPVAAGHDAVYAAMEAATRAGGEVGEAAKAAMEALRPHFEKEEDYALPQLGALTRLVGAPLAPEAEALTAAEREALIERTERPRQELPQMLEEHKVIADRLETLRQAAEAAGRPEYARLADEIERHAQTEAEVLYPAALLVGDYVRLEGGSPR
jgi:hypothetical protein